MLLKQLYIFLASCLLLSVLVLFSTCKKNIGQADNGFPADVSSIIIGKCATIGCHSLASKEACGGLCLETWDYLFKGSHGGADCIPFSHIYSTLCLFSNTYPDLGVVNTPSMPLNQTPLSREEVNTLMKWIDGGAPKSNGKIMWADNPNRKKFYVTNQGCDVVTSFDQASLLQMRCIPIGDAADISPHWIQVSPDGQYWYVCFYSGSYLQKYRASDDSYVGEVNIGNGSWNSLTITSDSKKAFVVNWAADGSIAYVDLENMQLKQTYQGSGLLSYPHGSAVNASATTLYITSLTGNFIYKIDITDPMNPAGFTQISLDGNPPNTNSSLDPHDIDFTPDGLYYCVSCEKSNEIRFMKISNDSLVATIHTGSFPQEIGLPSDTSNHYLFVTCMYDTTDPGRRGSVTVMNYKTFQWVKNIKTNMAEPHGIAVDDVKGLVYVANRNITGPLPHHSTSCSGRIGFVSFIDAKTLMPLPRTIEVSVDPYSISVR